MSDPSRIRPAQCGRPYPVNGLVRRCIALVFVLTYTFHAMGQTHEQPHLRAPLHERLRHAQAFGPRPSSTSAAPSQAHNGKPLSLLKRSKDLSSPEVFWQTLQPFTLASRWKIVDDIPQFADFCHGGFILCNRVESVMLWLGCLSGAHGQGNIYLDI